MNNRILIPVLCEGIFEQITFSLIRITISYRAIELDLSAVWLGAITATFSLLPLVFSLTTGRFVDRGHDARICWLGGVLVVAGSAGLAMSQSLMSLFVCSAVLGISQMFTSIGVQTLVARNAGSGGLERAIGNYLVANVVGQCIGPFIVGWAGGSASLPPTHLLFVIGVFSSLATCAALFMLRPAPKGPARSTTTSPTALRDIVRLPGLLIVLILSTATSTSQDLVVVYLPLLGAERGLGVAEVGNLLAIRSVASMASRMMFASLVKRLGVPRLMAITTFVSAAAFFGIAAPLPPFALYIAVAIAGAALGMSMTLSVARALVIPGPHVRGTANSLRQMGNRLGQVVVPTFAGAIATAAGTGGTFFAIGASLAAVWAVVKISGGQTRKDGKP